MHLMPPYKRAPQNTYHQMRRRISGDYKYIYLWNALLNTVWCFFLTSMQSGWNTSHWRSALRKLKSLCSVTPLVLSPGTDLLILKGQTGPIHKVTLECWGLSFQHNEKAIYWDDSGWGSICFPVVDFSAIILTNSPCILSPLTRFPSPWRVPNSAGSWSWSGSTQYSPENDLVLRDM